MKTIEKEIDRVKVTEQKEEIYYKDKELIDMEIDACQIRIQKEKDMLVELKEQRDLLN